MKPSFLLFALSALVLLVTLGVWASGGFHTGWSQDQIPTPYVDEITGIETVIFEDGFRAGLDFAVGGLFASSLLTGLGFFFLRRPRKKVS